MRPLAPLLTYATVRSLAGKPHQRVRVLAKVDPLRNVPVGNFTLADFSYEEANLAHHEFASCALLNLGAVA